MNLKVANPYSRRGWRYTNTKIHELDNKTREIEHHTENARVIVFHLARTSQLTGGRFARKKRKMELDRKSAHCVSQEHFCNDIIQVHHCSANIQYQSQPSQKNHHSMRHDKARKKKFFSHRVPLYVFRLYTAPL